MNLDKNEMCVYGIRLIYDNGSQTYDDGHLIILVNGFVTWLDNIMILGNNEILREVYCI